eukprot:7932293-Pyramimonas_sp.AAC.2
MEKSILPPILYDHNREGVHGRRLSHSQPRHRRDDHLYPRYMFAVERLTRGGAQLPLLEP